MANLEVSVRGMLSGKSVSIRALMANNSPTTQISQRLAKKLGLTQFKPVYITDANAGVGEFYLKWKVSLTPIIIQSSAADQKFIVSYPIVNCNEADAWWEMIIGQDSYRQDYKIYNFACNDRSGKPTPGPRFVEGEEFYGHNVRLCKPSEVPKNEFYEYPCSESEIISRIAIHKADRLLIAEFVDKEGVFKFSELPDELETWIEQGSSLDGVIAIVKETCPSVVIDAFPVDATLLWVQLEGARDKKKVHGTSERK